MNKFFVGAALIFAVACSDDNPGGDGPDGGPDGPDGPGMGTEIAMTVVPAGKAGVNHVVFAAYQDGEGLWQPMAATNGVYKARVQNGRYGIAFACAPFSRFFGANPEASIIIRHWTTGEKTDHTDEQCFEVDRPNTLAGTVTGDAALVFRAVEAPRGYGRVDSADYSYSLKVPAGKTDVFASGEGSLRTQLKLVRLRDVDPTTDSPLVIDLDAGVSPVIEAVTTPPGPTVSIGTALRTKDGAFALFLNMPQGEPFNVYRAAPSSLLRDGDLIRVRARTSDVSFSETSFAYLGAPAPVSLSFAPSFPSAAPAVVQGARVSLTFGFTPVTPTLPNVDYSVSAATIDDDGGFLQQTTFSRGWVGTASSIAYSFPDFSSIPGWLSVMAIQPRKKIFWRVSKLEYNTEQYVAGRLFRATEHFGEVGEYCGNTRVEPVFEQCDPPNGTTCSETCQTIP
jgi:hypothetical protein